MLLKAFNWQSKVTARMLLYSSDCVFTIRKCHLKSFFPQNAIFYNMSNVFYKADNWNLDSSGKKRHRPKIREGYIQHRAFFPYLQTPHNAAWQKNLSGDFFGLGNSIFNRNSPRKVCYAGRNFTAIPVMRVAIRRPHRPFPQPEPDLECLNSQGLHCKLIIK